MSLGVALEKTDTTGISQFYHAIRDENNYSFNQFVSVKNQLKVDVAIEHTAMIA